MLPENNQKNRGFVMLSGKGTKIKKTQVVVKRDTYFSILCIFKEKVYTLATSYDGQDSKDGLTFCLY